MSAKLFMRTYFEPKARSKCAPRSTGEEPVSTQVEKKRLGHFYQNPLSANGLFRNVLGFFPLTFYSQTTNNGNNENVPGTF